jgi:hypothetical protein
MSFLYSGVFLVDIVLFVLKEIQMLFSHIKTIIVISMIGIIILGCGGGGSSSSSVTDSNTGSVESSGTALMRMKSVECLNTQNLEAGRVIQLRGVLENTKAVQEDVRVSYMLVPAGMLENNDTSELGGNIAYDMFTPALGDTIHDINATLPPSLATGSYRILAVINPEEYMNVDVNLSSQDAIDAYEKAYAVSDNLQIQANDGKPDIEITYIAINDNTKIQTSTRATADTILTFDVGVIDDKVILNNTNLSFLGMLGLRTSIANASDVKTTACLEFGGKCKTVKIYSVDENNQTHLDSDFIISSIELEKNEDVLFNVIIDNPLLEELVIASLKDNTLIAKLKVSITDIDESATQEPSKNSIETGIRFSPVILSRVNIDNTNDIIAPALSNYKYSLHEYINDIKIIDTGYTVSNPPSLFNPGLELTVNNPIPEMSIINPTQIKDNSIIKFEPVDTTPDFKLIEPVLIPQAKVDDPKDDPLKIVARSDIVTQISLKDGVTSALLDGYIRDVAKETVNEKVFGDGFKAEFGNDYISLSANLNGQAMFNRNGAVLTADASLDVDLYIADFSMLGVDGYAGIKPAQLEETGYQFDLEFLGFNIYTRGANVVKDFSLANSTAGDVKIRVKENVTKLQNYLDTQAKSLEISEIPEYTKNADYTETIVIVVVPVAVKLEAGGQIGIEESVRLKSAGMIKSSIAPFAKLKGSASAGIGTAGLSAGVRGTLTLIKEKLSMTFASGIKYEQDSTRVHSYLGSISFAIVNTVTPPEGKIDIYVDYPEPYIAKKCKCCCGRCVCIYYPYVRTATYTKNIAHFESKNITKILLIKDQKLFRIGL